MRPPRFALVIGIGRAPVERCLVRLRYEALNRATNRDRRHGVTAMYGCRQPSTVIFPALDRARSMEG